MYSIFVGFGIFHASTEVASTLFYHYLLLVLLPHYLRQLPFLPPHPPLPLPPPEHAFNIINSVSVPLGVLSQSLHPSSDAPVQVPPTTAASVEIVRDGENSADFDGSSGYLLPSSSYASSSISSSLSASSVSSASSDSLFSSPSLPPLSHLSDSEPPPPRTAY